MLSPPDTSANKRAASYTLSRILSTDKPFTHQELAIEIAFSILHRPFLVLSEDANLEEGSPDLLRPDPSVVLPRLITLVSNADPSPSLISAILSPIATSLYSLLHCMDQVKTSDPTLTHSLRGLLITWGKIVNPSDGVDILWHLVEDEAESWKIEPNGFHRSRECVGCSTSMVHVADLPFISALSRSLAYLCLRRRIYELRKQNSMPISLICTPTRTTSWPFLKILIAQKYPRICS